jgi:hypothetical protein
MSYKTHAIHEFKCDRCGATEVVDGGGPLDESPDLPRSWAKLILASRDERSLSADLCTGCRATFGVWFNKPPSA